MTLGTTWKINGLARFSDFTLLLLRLVTGAFLIHETWDNVTSAGRMKEFAEFLAHFNFPLPYPLAPLSVAVQFGCGALLIAANFAIAVYMVHWMEEFRGWWPALILVFLGLHFAAAGAGKFGADRMFGNRKG